MENDIRKYEKEALAFGREIFGNKLADAVYIKTMGSCQYLGPGKTGTRKTSPEGAAAISRG